MASVNNRGMSEKDQPAPASSTDLQTDDAGKATDYSNRGPGKEGDLVIRDGFPALYIPSSGTDSNEKTKDPLSFQPMVKGEEPIPRHGFWSSEDVIRFNGDNTTTLQMLREDCETVFTARDKPDGAAYSAGQTFFIPSNMKPRCALEALALKIFHEHTKDLAPGTFNPTQSGANWWTLVMDDDAESSNDVSAPASAAASSASANSVGAGPKTTGLEDSQDDEEGDDEVGLHFDADYELEEQTGNILLHPRVATVTYLSDHGAPTLILEQKSPPMDDLKKKTLEKGIKKAWLSHPKVGKHTAFDGRFLHGAPALYFPPNRNNTDVADESKEPAAKRRKVVQDTKRYTLLVNVWLNHWVMDAGLLDDDVCTQLKAPWEDEKCNLKGDDDYKQPFDWNKEVDLTKDPTNLKKVKLSPSNVDPAGEDEIALCNHNVTVKYNPLMEECHAASFSGLTVELELENGAISLHVGEELTDEEEEDEEADE
mmetsp:Transcript_16128/g.44665  ORF Transcript_16128/g.44665 Transcript_16128/m.44665 type:complete len:482 (-) Transcript_16128:854-2299(-)|eukprot:CAMPEP_0172375082 /NCGR_PEP_ID=MMETSP1060-20121228/59472_1 /TAXON_ID=37318 /ORGANISM="Pseudo-nitzschia pungens, Strain cf. cingulata" /LENGTH=481 /DNA_ID=CAMNT_0013102047 /DNA_START=126 /DNA_END=1571 /DNA_ORIENTATION=+